MRVALVIAVLALTGAVGATALQLPADDPGSEAVGTEAVAPAVTPAGDFRWPLAGMPAVVRPFTAPAHRYGPGHRGVDLAATPGTEVLAVASGTVVFAGQVAGHGVVSVDHPGGLRSTYEPVTAAVRAGQVVSGGQVLGTLEAGHPGCTAPACLHWGIRRGADYLDPLRLLSHGPLRLLPWSGEVS